MAMSHDGGAGRDAPLVTAADLAVGRGGAAILEAVDFALAPGAALALRGPNGIGKTTLLRTLAGLQPPLCGRVEAAPESLAYAGHADGVKAAMSVRENLDFWAGLFGVCGHDEAVEAYALGPLLDRPAGALSAGQRRRLALSRLLATRAPVWLADEPTAALDESAAAMFAAAAAAHRRRGGAVIVATHLDCQLDAAQQLDLAAFAARGAEGTP